MVANVFLFPASLVYMNLADAIILAYTSPIWVVALAPILLREQVTWQQWSAVLIGFVGATLVVKPFGGDLNWAIFLPLNVAIVVALRDMFTRHIAARESSLAIVMYSNILTFIIGSMTLPFGWQLPSLLQLAQIVGAGTLFAASMFFMVESFRWAEATILLLQPIGTTPP